jgi:hypothetical protein
MHFKTAMLWRKLYNKVSVAVIVLNALSTIGNFSGANTSFMLYVMYASGLASFCCIILSGVQRFYNCEKKSSDHFHFANRYGNFYRQLKFELNMPRSGRSIANEIRRWAQLEYDAMQKEGPMIDEKVIREYVEKHADEGENRIPDIAMESLHISVCMDP